MAFLVMDLVSLAVASHIICKVPTSVFHDQSGEIDELHIFIADT